VDRNRNNKVDRRKVSKIDIQNVACHPMFKSGFSAILKRFDHLSRGLFIGVKRPNLVNVSDWLNKVQLLPNEFLLALVANCCGTDRTTNPALRRIDRLKEAVQ
jgi:hypothetical protein